MSISNANGVDLWWQEDGCRAGPTVLLLHGIGCQVTQWPTSVVTGLVDSGFHVLRLDHRDVGLSQKMDLLGTVSMLTLMTAHLTGKLPHPPYTLQDMAQDAGELLLAIGKTRAHVVGVSMGGMIAQRMAIHYPHLVASLTSIMSSSGAPGLPPPDASAMIRINSQPPSTNRCDVIAHMGQTWDLIGGPHYKSTEVGMGRLREAAYDRCPRHAAGYLRQMAAIVADVERASLLKQIDLPTLVVHGEADVLIPLACGADTARRIPNARFAPIPRMGHDLPEPLIPSILQTLIAHLHHVPTCD